MIFGERKNSEFSIIFSSIYITSKINIVVKCVRLGCKMAIAESYMILRMQSETMGLQ